MRYLAIDLGEKRTGIAAGDDVTGIVSPIEVIDQPRGAALDARLDSIIQGHRPDAIVIGLPLNMDDTEGPAAKSARQFGESLRQRRGIEVHYQDERLTSHAAEQQLSGTGRTRKRKRELRDALAAAEILRDYIDAQRKR
jgi:putative Holliday junction resolvase